MENLGHGVDRAGLVLYCLGEGAVQGVCISECDHNT